MEEKMPNPEKEDIDRKAVQPQAPKPGSTASVTGVDMSKIQQEDMLAKEAMRKDAAEKAAAIKHVWTNDDTYAGLAQKFYGSAKEPYWRLIFEFNKDIIGADPNMIRTGTEIRIPPLPEELKKK